ncbi:hypothetical protein AB0C27_20550 [Nonomuraea sp. NPDC048882]|uniref:hypothetical protein n=1 Tax=Nonomuraea sp. NPDC048882 TaxID=3154347 RepID=UPI0033C8FC9A
MATSNHSPAVHPPPQPPVAICAGIAGAALMVYLATSGLWLAWRGLATFGRIVLDLVDGKWLLVAFSPVLLLLRPLRAKLHRYRVKRGIALGRTPASTSFSATPTSSRFASATPS